VGVPAANKRRFGEDGTRLRDARNKKLRQGTASRYQEKDRERESVCGPDRQTESVRDKQETLEADGWGGQCV
jgi:hypothetical protein